MIIFTLLFVFNVVYKKSFLLNTTDVLHVKPIEKTSL